MVSSAIDFVRLSKSKIWVWPQDPVLSVLGCLMVTVVSADVVDGGVFRTHSLAATVRGFVTVTG